MHAFEIYWNDWQRIFLGEAPGSFYLEVLLRITFIYLLIIICLRLMGKRMAAQLSRNDLLALSALAASIGIPLQTPERGLLPALIVALVVVGGQRLVAFISTRNQRIERESQGDITILIDDCCLQYRAMKKTRISKDRVLSQLRAHGVGHLGEVKRLYFEASGSFSLIKNKEAVPGLSVIPAEDPEMAERQKKADDTFVCDNCGKVKETDTCNSCGNEEFVQAVL